MRGLQAGLLTAVLSTAAWGQHALVFQSDFGTQDGAVAAMKGVAVSIAPNVAIYDVTHEIPAFNIWEAALRLQQTATYWPPGTVFVSVVDPGVGTERESVVLKTNSGHYFVTPDNGTLTLVAEQLGVAALRKIDEAVNRRPGSAESYTFHGRDVYALTGARLAAGEISFEQVGPLLTREVVAIAYRRASFEQGLISGHISTLDARFGNVWTNIHGAMFQNLGARFGDNLTVLISRGSETIFDSSVPYGETFGAVPIGEALLYLNSLNNVALAINQGSFAEKFGIESGHDWNIAISRR